MMMKTKMRLPLPQTDPRKHAAVNVDNLIHSVSGIKSST